MTLSFRNFSLLLLFCAFVSANIYELDLNDTSQYEVVRNKPVKIMKGDVLRLVVNENPTTGFLWLFQTPEQRNVETMVYKITKNYYIENKEHTNEG